MEPLIKQGSGEEFISTPCSCDLHDFDGGNSPDGSRAVTMFF